MKLLMLEPLRLILVVLLICSSLSIPNLVFSEEKESQLSRRDIIFGVHYVDKELCWAVGADGLVLKTTDGGKSWERREKVTNLSLNDIFFFNDKGWIVGQDGLILVTDDGGISWDKKATGTEAMLFRISFINSDRGFAVGGKGTILSTEDGGEVWKPCPVDWLSILTDELILGGVISPNLYDVFFFDESVGWIVGDNGIVFRTSDGGKNWELMRIGLFPPLFSVFLRNQSEGWAVGQNGLVLKTNDGGENWTEMKVPTERSLFKIRIFDSYGFMAGDQATVLQTFDAGLTWQPMKLKTSPPFPYFADGWVLSNNSPKEIVLLGEQILRTRIVPPEGD